MHALSLSLSPQSKSKWKAKGAREQLHELVPHHLLLQSQSNVTILTLAFLSLVWLARLTYCWLCESVNTIPPASDHAGLCRHVYWSSMANQYGHALQYRACCKMSNKKSQTFKGDKHILSAFWLLEALLPGMPLGWQLPSMAAHPAFCRRLVLYIHSITITSVDLSCNTIAKGLTDSIQINKRVPL